MLAAAKAGLTAKGVELNRWLVYYSRYVLIQVVHYLLYCIISSAYLVASSDPCRTNRRAGLIFAE